MSTLYKINANNKAEIISRNDVSFLEKEIEDFTLNNGEILLEEKILFIGRQVLTETNKRIDLLAIDINGRLIVIELKRGIAPRDMMAQILDYSSWLNKLSEREIEKIAREYFDKNNLPYKSLLHAYEVFFGKTLDDIIGSEIVNILFAEDFPQDLLNAAEYLFDNNISVYCIKFEHYKDEKEGNYILIQSVIGNERSKTAFNKEEKDKSSNDDVLREYKRDIKKLFSQLAQHLEEKNTDWGEHFTLQRDSFKSFQTKSGDWTMASTKFGKRKNRIEIAFSILGIQYSRSNPEKTNFQECAVRLVLPRADYGERYDEINNYLEKINYTCLDNSTINKDFKNDFYFEKILITEDKSTDIELDDSYFNKLADQEIECLRPLIDSLIKESI